MPPCCSSPTSKIKGKTSTRGIYRGEGGVLHIKKAFPLAASLLFFFKSNLVYDMRSWPIRLLLAVLEMKMHVFTFEGSNHWNTKFQHYPTLKYITTKEKHLQKVWKCIKACINIVKAHRTIIRFCTSAWEEEGQQEDGFLHTSIFLRCY